MTINFVLFKKIADVSSEYFPIHEKKYSIKKFLNLYVTL